MGRPIPQELRQRLRPVVMMLSSAADGEVLAAARSIARLLARHKLDWSDLADHVSADTSAPVTTSAAPSGWGAIGAEMQSAQLGEIVATIRAHGRLTDRAREFLVDLEARALLYPSVHLTPKQHEWLIGLAENAAARMAS
jgi:hypothetical protein